MPIRRSYELIHSKHRRTYGEAKYRALQVVSKLIPIGLLAQVR